LLIPDINRILQKILNPGDTLPQLMYARRQGVVLDLADLEVRFSSGCMLACIDVSIGLLALANKERRFAQIPGTG
jgi:hypothetical protein